MSLNSSCVYLLIVNIPWASQWSVPNLNNRMWHMPHGISLHIALKNSNSYYLLWGSSINQPASATTGPSCKPAQAHHHHAPPASPLSCNFLRFSCHLWCTPQNIPASTQSIRCNSHLMKTRAFLLLGKIPKILAQIIMPEINFWLLTKMLNCSQRNSEQTNTTSDASSYRRWWCTSPDLRPSARSFLIDLLGITNLPSLSPNKLGMPIYFINEMAFLHLTRNSTE